MYITYSGCQRQQEEICQVVGMVAVIVGRSIPLKNNSYMVGVNINS